MLKHESVQGSVEDVYAEEKKAEETLRTSENYLKAILNSIFTGVVVVDEKTHEIVDANPNALEAIGASKEHVIGKVCHSFICPAEKGKCPISDLGQTVDRSERVLLRANGERVSILKTVTTTTWRGRKYLVESFLDITERKKVEEALRESEEKYRTQFEEALDAIFVADAETGIIIDCNRAASELVGREKSELVGKHQRILHPPEEIEGKFSRTYKQHLEEKEGQVLETQVITKRGEIKDVAIKANVIELRGKKLIQGVFRDITERKKIEAEVAYERDLLHVLMDNIPDTIYFKDVASHFTRINRAQALCLRAKDPEEAIGKTDFDYYAEEFAREAYVDEQRILKTRKPLVEKVEKVKWNDGKSRWVSATKVPIIDKDGRITGLVGISRDITEIKEMEEKLRQYSEHLEELVQKRTEELLESEKRYSVLVEEASDGVAILQDGKIVFTNKKGTEITGYSKDELIGLPFEKLVSEEYKQLTKERYERRLRGEIIPSQYEIELIAETGNQVPVELSATRIQYQGRPADLIIVRDISERKRMEEERLRLEKLATVGELATMVGHDLRNPLQSIENAVYYLKNECAPKLPVSIPQKAKEMFQVISDSVDYADKIIRDLQDFSAIKTPRLEKTDINAMIKETLSRVHIPNNIELRTELGALPEIKVDKDEIKRVFMNLTTNGIQAMENGGTLTVATKKTEGFVEVSFKDTGIGISNENMEKLFTPFFTTKAKGMGIGLSICKKFVESHGGNIEVKSEVGKGTAFTVKLPIHQEGGGEKT
jgi:PAS domain S-box-containing protein